MPLIYLLAIKLPYHAVKHTIPPHFLILLIMHPTNLSTSLMFIHSFSRSMYSLKFPAQINYLQNNLVAIFQKEVLTVAKSLASAVAIAMCIKSFTHNTNIMHLLHYKLLCYIMLVTI